MTIVRNVRRGWLVAACLVACLASTAQAQTASASGTITDTSGATVPGAKITAKNSATGAERTAETGSSGTYSLTNIPAGQYDITVEKEGFATARFDHVVLTVAQALSLSAELQPGAITNQVVVEGSAVAPIELENAQLSNVVDHRRIVDLPLVTRDPYSLVLLSPGVVQSTGYGGFSVNGARERNNNFLLDGADNNDTSVPGGPSGLIALNPESTQEFRVITNNFLPEYGRNNGAIIDIITKSGTNTLHGDAYWFGRYNALGARDYFNTKPDRQDPYVRNDFGYSLGGPIIKDRTFFFFNSEYQRFRTTLTNASVVPTAAFKSGVFTFDGFNVNLANPNSPNNVQGLPLDSTVQKLLTLLPNPNGEAVDDVRAIYRFPSTSTYNAATVVFKVDQRISQAHNLSLRYAYGGSGDPNGSHDDFVPGLGSVGFNAQVHAISANLSSTLRPTLVNEFRAGVNRLDVPFFCGGVSQLNQFTQLDQFGAGSDYSISGIPTIGCAALASDGQGRRTGTWTLNDNLTKVKGNHTLKFGGEFRFVFENGYNAFYSRQAISFNAYSTFGAPIVNLDPNHPCDPNTGDNCGGAQFQNMASGLLGLVDSQFQAQFFNKNGERTAHDDRKFKQHEYGVFFQDSWKARPNLTFNFGLRYQFNGVPFEKDGNLSNLFADPAGFAPFTFSLVGPGSGRLLYNNDKTNFEPRVGFSWDPFKKGKTAIRGGYGIFHDRVFGNLFGNARGNPPFEQDIQNFPGDVLGNVTAPPTTVASPIVQDGAFIFANLFDPNFKMPYSHNWNFGIQHELPFNTTIEVNYVGNKGSRELRVVNGNQPQTDLINIQLADGVSPNLLQFSNLYFFDTTNNTAFFQPGVVKSIGNSTYNGLQAKVTRRFSHGLQIQGSYTYSHAIDDASDPLRAVANNRSFPRNSFNLHEERGNSDFDQRQRLILNYVYELPFGKGRTYLKDGAIGRIMEGWQISGISLFEDGHPYDIFGDVDSEHTSLSSRASLVGNPAIPAGSPRNQTGPIVSAFDVAPFGSPGNLGRNTFTGPGSIVTDLVVSKLQSLTERVHMQLRVEFFNLFNRPQFAQPGNLIQDPGTFGLSTATVTRSDNSTSARQIQLALKLMF
jgi:hypothetical protein